MAMMMLLVLVLVVLMSAPVSRRRLLHVKERASVQAALATEYATLRSVDLAVGLGEGVFMQFQSAASDPRRSKGLCARLAGGCGYMWESDRGVRLWDKIVEVRPWDK